MIIATVALALIFLDIGEGIRRRQTGGGRRCPRQLPFHRHGHQLFDLPTATFPLQNFWSLAVEEQFYVVYPTLFLLVASARGLTFRARMAIGLVAVMCVSLIYSIVDTHNNPVGAFFAFHPGLGAGPRRIGCHRYSVAPEDSRPLGRHSYLAGPRRCDVCRLYLHIAN